MSDLEASYEEVVDSYRDQFCHNARSLKIDPVTLFCSPAEQIKKLRGWNKKYNLGLRSTDIDNPPEPPQPRLLKPFQAVNLRVCLEGKGEVSGVQRTFDELWKIASAQYGGAWKWVLIRSEPEYLRVLPGSDYEPGLRWEVIDFVGNVAGKDPWEVTDPVKSPHAGILLAIAAHQNWVRNLEWLGLPDPVISGYQLTLDDPGYEAWAEYVYFSFEIKGPGPHKGNINMMASPFDAGGGAGSSHYALPDIIL